MAVDPETSPPINLATAMTMLATSAIAMMRVLSPWAALRRAVAERRWGVTRNIGRILSFPSAIGSGAHDRYDADHRRPSRFVFVSAIAFLVYSNAPGQTAFAAG